MRIGIISDIHSNIIAFRACTAYLESKKCEEYLFLGDYVSDTPYTRETLDYLYEFMSTHKCHLLRGNREEYMLGQRNARLQNKREQFWTWNSASGNLLFTYEQMTEADFEFFDSLPITFRYEKAGYPPITCCHGSPDNARELLQLDGRNTERWLAQIDTDYMICAHTHFPGERTYNRKHYYNAGCVGIAIKDAGMAQCMILDAVEENGKPEWKPTFLKLPYDNKQVVRDIGEGGLLESAPWFINGNIHILLTGVDRCAELVQLAGKLAQEADKRQIWPNIDEKYFEQAALQLGIPDYRNKLDS